MPPTYQQDPNDLLDYLFDFAALTNGTGPSDWLAVGETITVQTVTPDAGLTLNSSIITNAGTSVTAWLTGGVSGTTYAVTCHITTSLGRAVDETIYIHVLSTTALPATPAESVYDQYEDQADYGNCAVPLHRYAALIGYDEPAFWGVRYDGQEERACNGFWDEARRMQIANALNEAQWDIERIVGYPLCPTWVTGDWNDGDGSGRWSDTQPYVGCHISRHPMVIAPGVRGETDLALSAAVNCTNDPAVIGPIATTITDIREVQVFYAGTDRRIYPSSITISGGNLFVRIPRCRLVLRSLSSLRTGIEYTNLNNFASTVDVKRIYNDPSTHALLLQPHACSYECSTNGCSAYTQTACMYFTNPRLGFLKVEPATYSGGTWTRNAGACGRSYSLVQLNYYCGMRVLSKDAEMAIVRLAHNKVAESLCSCDTFTTMWKFDRETPRGNLTRSLQNMPFGISAGARYAFNVAKRLKIFRGNGTF